jgi:hypothetical protein
LPIGEWSSADVGGLLAVCELHTDAQQLVWKRRALEMASQRRAIKEQRVDLVSGLVWVRED